MKVLCSGLPYGIMCNHYNRTEIIANISDKGFYQPMSRDGWHSIEEIKPYLRPMSSMTEEEWTEYEDMCDSFRGEEFYKLIDWANKNMFDYRGLIPRGLALEAPLNMYNIK